MTPRATGSGSDSTAGTTPSSDSHSRSSADSDSDTNTNPSLNPNSDETTLTWLALAADETVHWRGGPRLQTGYPWVGLAALGTATVLAAVSLEVLSWLGLLWLPLFVAPALWQYAQLSRTEFVITTRRIAIRRGVLGRSVRTVALDHVQNTTVTQDPIARLAGYGTVSIRTAAGAELAFWNVDGPSAVRERLEAQRTDDAGGDRAPEIPGTIEQWEAVLDAVRDLRRHVERSL